MHCCSSRGYPTVPTSQLVTVSLSDTAQLKDRSSVSQQLLQTACSSSHATWQSFSCSCSIFVEQTSMQKEKTPTEN
jgi:hypothetical protein